MNATDILSDLQEAGFRVRSDGARLIVHPSDKLTVTRRELIVKNRDALLALVPPPPPVPYDLVTDAAGVERVREALATHRGVVGLDTETTGFTPREGRLRLLQLAIGGRVFIVDAFAVDPAPLWGPLHDSVLVFHNALFDLQFMLAAGYVPGKCRCTLLLSQLVYGTRTPKGFHGLQAVAEREVGQTLDKSEQVSDWSSELTPEQLQYAARDAAVLVPIYGSIRAKIKAAGLLPTARLEHRALPAVAWLSSRGVAFDRERWYALAAEAATESSRLAAELDQISPGTNWNSPKQVKAAFAAVGIDLPDTTAETLASIDHPLAVSLRGYRSANKLTTTYGRDWTRDSFHDGRLFPGWKQIGADSGRMACRAPNAQNLPHNPRYRACFVAPPERVVLKADYSQIELRIAAKISGDAALVAAFERGDDLHETAARAVLGAGEVTPEQRTLAKSLNFGLLFGMGARGFQRYARSNYAVALTEREAFEYRDRFFRAYPGLAAWHGRLRLKRPKETRTLAGRRRLLTSRDSDTLRLNSPVQGSGADILKTALALLWERQTDCPGAVPVLAVHDEIVVEADADQIVNATTWLRRAMIDAASPILDPVPAGPVDVVVCRDWSGTPPDAIKRGARALRMEQPAEGLATAPARLAPIRLDPPAKRFGGKQPLARRIIGLFPERFTTYCEPFVGAAGVALAMNPEGIGEVWNDLDGDLITWWRCLQRKETFERFRRIVENCPVSEKAWREAGTICPEADPVERAAAFFIRTRQSYSAIGAQFGGVSKGRTRRGMVPEASAWLRAVDGLAEIHARLRRVLLLCRPAVDAIKLVDSSETLFYCDPPYVQSARACPDVYAHEMTEKDHVELLEVLLAVKGKVILSGYRSDLYDTTLADWRRVDWPRPIYAAGGGRSKRRAVESVWLNY